MNRNQSQDRAPDRKAPDRMATTHEEAKIVAPMHVTNAAKEKGGAYAVAEAEKRFLKTYESWAVIKKIQVMPLDLSIECQQLQNVERLGGLFSKIDPFAVVFLRAADAKEGDEWTEIGRTEVIKDTTDPKFINSISIKCEEKNDSKKHVKVEVYAFQKVAEIDSQDLSKHKLIGTAHTVLQTIIDSPAQCLSVSLDDPKGKDRFRGSLTLQLDTITLEDQPKKVNLCVKLDPEGNIVAKKKVFMVLSRALRKNHWARVYRSELLVTTKGIEFEPLKLSLESLAAGEEERAFRIELFKDAPAHLWGQELFGTTTLIGFAQTSINKLKNLKMGQSVQWWSASDGLLPGGVKIEANRFNDNEYNFTLTITA